MILSGRLEFGNLEPDEVAPSWLGQTSNQLTISAGIQDHLSLKRNIFETMPLWPVLISNPCEYQRGILTAN